jgi:hypothetical protein
MIECACCGYKTIAREYEQNHGGKVKLCVLCAGSMAGTAYLNNYSDSATCRTICYVGNVILDAIKKSAEHPPIRSSKL